MKSTSPKVGALVKALRAVDTGIRSAASAFDRKAHQALRTIERAAKSFGVITSAIFNAEIREPLNEAMKDSKRYTDASRKSTLSYHHRALIGLSQPGTVYAPLDTESEQDYVKRVTDSLKSAKLYVPTNKGGNGGKRKAKKGAQRDGKAVTVTVDGALAKLVGKNLADRQMVHYLIKNHMDKLRALAAQYMPKDGDKVA